MRLTTGTMLQVAQDVRLDDHRAADRRRRADAHAEQARTGATATTRSGRADRPTGLRRLISIGLHA